MELSAVATPHTWMAFTNCVYVHPTDFEALGLVHVDVLGKVYRVHSSADVDSGRIALSSPIRNFLMVELDRRVIVKPFVIPEDETLYLDSLEIELALHGKQTRTQPLDIDCRELTQEVSKVFSGQILLKGMVLYTKFQDAVCKLTVNAASQLPQLTGTKAAPTSANPVIAGLKSGAGGILTTKTAVQYNKAQGAPVRLAGQMQKKSANNMIGTDFEKLGIGGLNKEFNQIFRRAFASRILPPDVTRKLGIKHVRGMILHGPPGTGKTLIARQISAVLQGGENARPPKVVSGPEILSKYVGDSEKNVRELFAEAEEEQASAGDDSELHVIIFDELDAICRQRGARRDGTGVGDSVVNQLLAKIDGVNSLNNVLLIGMTNRLDMLDTALLRPGRFEVQVEIGLPDEEGRLQILKIHTRSMREGNCLDDTVDLPYLAANTKNFSGAEIEGLVKSAVSYATQRHVNTEDLSKLLDAEHIKVLGSDFEGALLEVHPAFGVQGEDEMKGLYRNGVIPFSDAAVHLQETLSRLAKQSQSSSRTPLLSVLLSGLKGSGKTAVVARMAAEAGFDFTKLISADSMLGMAENQKVSQIAQVFDDAYKSPISLIVIDDIERLIEYVPVGQRFSNGVLQALLVLINKPPPREDRKLMVIGTTAIPELMHSLGLTQVFNVELALPLLETDREIAHVFKYMMEAQVDPLRVQDEQLANICHDCKKPMSVKTLLLVIEMARQETSEALTYGRFMECLNSVGGF